MTFTAVNPPNLESIITSFGQYPYNLEIKTSGSNKTYDLPTTVPLTNYVMNIAHTSDSTTTLTVEGIAIPIGGIVAFVFSPQTGSWYDSTSGSSSTIQLTGPVTAGPGSGSLATSITAGAIHPAAISITGTDDFTFPRNVIATGTLTASGTLTLLPASSQATLNVGNGSGNAQLNIKSGAGNQAITAYNANGDKWYTLLQVDSTYVISDAVNGVTCFTVYPHGGVAPTKLSTTNKNALTGVAGMMVYDTTLNKLCVFTGSAWETVTSS